MLERHQIEGPDHIDGVAPEAPDRSHLAQYYPDPLTDNRPLHESEAERVRQHAAKRRYERSQVHQKVFLVGVLIATFIVYVMTLMLIGYWALTSDRPIVIVPVGFIGGILAIALIKGTIGRAVEILNLYDIRSNLVVAVILLATTLSALAAHTPLINLVDGQLISLGAASAIVSLLVSLVTTKVMLIIATGTLWALRSLDKS
ncbi:hypothetical protein B7Y94_05305 [Candidatus Saccharibacteria bacterium 32-49-12]|nr:MAG: hypothetical protein B7Y94_05305 [Candidatus Saccharibacteria bacterium 32-49-12]